MKLKQLLLILLFIPALSRAEVLVLVHGWAANPDTWGTSGVLQVLANNNWEDGGVLPSRFTPALSDSKSDKNSKIYYRANVPSHAPITIQANVLLNVIKTIKKQHPDEKLIIAGHSAGGLAARLMLISPDAPEISKFITIATPNLGTPRAIQGLNYTNNQSFFFPGPGVDLIKTIAGGNQYRYLKHSRQVIQDMLPEQYRGFVYWLNKQPHPDTRYYSIIKTADGYTGDEMVSKTSQDLSNVKTISSNVVVINTQSHHTLNPNDGLILEQILSGKYDD